MRVSRIRPAVREVDELDPVVSKGGHHLPCIVRGSVADDDRLPALVGLGKQSRQRAVAKQRPVPIRGDDHRDQWLVLVERRLVVSTSAELPQRRLGSAIDVASDSDCLQRSLVVGAELGVGGCYGAGDLIDPGREALRRERQLLHLGTCDSNVCPSRSQASQHLPRSNHSAPKLHRHDLDQRFAHLRGLRLGELRRHGQTEHRAREMLC